MNAKHEYQRYLGDVLDLWDERGDKPTELIVTPEALVAFSSVDFDAKKVFGGTVSYREISPLEQVKPGEGRRIGIVVRKNDAGLAMVQAIELA